MTRLRDFVILFSDFFRLRDTMRLCDTVLRSYIPRSLFPLIIACTIDLILSYLITELLPTNAKHNSELTPKFAMGSSSTSTARQYIRLLYENILRILFVT